MQQAHVCVDFQEILDIFKDKKCQLHRRDSKLGISHARNYLRTFGLHEIFKCAHL